MESLLFWDDLVVLKREIEEIALIDHNALDPEQAEILNANDKVTRIIDHHFDLLAYTDEQLKQKQVQFVGSACSLLVLLIKKSKFLFLFKFWDKSPINFAYFLGAAISLDTYNFRKDLEGTKWHKDDFEAFEFLKLYAELGDNYFNHLCDIKFDQNLALNL